MLPPQLYVLLILHYDMKYLPDTNSYTETATSNLRSSQLSGSLCCGRRWYFRKPAL